MMTIPRLSALIRFFGPIFAPASRNDVLDDNELETFPHLGDALLRQANTIKSATEEFLINFEIPQGVVATYNKQLKKYERSIKDRKPNKIDDRINYAIQVKDVFISGNTGAR